MTDLDFTIENHGSITLVRPLHDSATAWLMENVAREGDGSIWFGGALAVEPRYLDALVEGIEAAGFTTRED